VPESSLSDCEIVLASASPRRRELLDQIGIHYHVLASDLDESMLAGEAVLAHVRRLARAKAGVGRSRILSNGIDKPVLGADTVVEIDGIVLGKPGDSSQAMQMLTRLSGNTHRVHTAVAVASAQGEFVDVNTSEVVFMTLERRQIERYIATGEPMDKAGAYAIQGIAGQFVRSLRGSFSSVVGLPLYETAQLLARCGVATIHGPRPDGNPA
jgi:septum formation protein